MIKLREDRCCVCRKRRIVGRIVTQNGLPSTLLGAGPAGQDRMGAVGRPAELTFGDLAITMLKLYHIDL